MSSVTEGAFCAWLVLSLLALLRIHQRLGELGTIIAFGQMRVRVELDENEEQEKPDLRDPNVN